MFRWMLSNAEVVTLSSQPPAIAIANTQIIASQIGMYWTREYAPKQKG